MQVMRKMERRLDRSCRTLADGKKPFHQCQTCDPSKQLYICSTCFRNGNHSLHSHTTQTNYSDIVFCNCGDVTGRLSCTQHRLFKGKNELRQPLHFNDKFFDEFISELNIPAQSGRQLARLNRIRRVFFKSDDGKMIKAYFDQTNAHKTTMYYRKAYSVYRKDHEKRFVQKGFQKERRHLLWHGTRLSNLESILKIGFRLPVGSFGTVNGAMFGSGIYFADRVSKSANYTDGSGNEILFLCEVALGSMYPTGEARDSVPGAFDSIKGVGTNIPDENNEGLLDEIIVPFGETIQSPVLTFVDTNLNYNEYVVYDPERILIRFVVQFDRNPNNYRRNFNAPGLSGQQFLQPNGGQQRSRPYISRPQNGLSALFAASSGIGRGPTASRAITSGGFQPRASSQTRNSTISGGPQPYSRPSTTPSTSVQRSTRSMNAIRVVPPARAASPTVSMSTITSMSISSSPSSSSTTSRYSQPIPKPRTSISQGTIQRAPPSRVASPSLSPSIITQRRTPSFSTTPSYPIYAQPRTSSSSQSRVQTQRVKEPRNKCCCVIL